MLPVHAKDWTLITNAENNAFHIPKNIQFLYVISFGPGGGGGAGAVGDLSVARGGGGGGGSGVTSHFIFPRIFLPDVLLFTTGKGGVGGVTGVGGNAGSNIVRSQNTNDGLNALIRGPNGGGGGGVGSTTAGAVGLTSFTLVFAGAFYRQRTHNNYASQSGSSTGQSGTAGGVGAVGGAHFMSNGFNGGCGGGGNSTTTAFAGGQLSMNIAPFNAFEIPGGLAGGGRGNNGIWDNRSFAGTGASGGGSNIAGAGGNGGDGALGCGGGGGGSGTTARGEGGRGGDGYFLVSWW